MSNIYENVKIDINTLKYYVECYFINDLKEPIDENNLNNYVNFVLNKNNEELTENFEYHHIVPKFTNCSNNNVIFKLSLEDHLYSHYLLAKVFKFEFKNTDYRSKAMFSLNLLYNRTKAIIGENDEIKTFIKNNFKEFVSNNISNSLKNQYKNGKRKPINPIWNYGRKVKQETKNKISNSNIGKKRSDEIKEKLSKQRKNNPKYAPPNHKGDYQLNNGIKRIWCKPEKLEEYLNNGWKKGWKLK